MPPSGRTNLIGSIGTRSMQKGARGLPLAMQGPRRRAPWRVPTRADRGSSGRSIEWLPKRVRDPYQPAERGWIKTKNKATRRFADERAFARASQASGSESAFVCKPSCRFVLRLDPTPLGRLIRVADA